MTRRGQGVLVLAPDPPLARGDLCVLAHRQAGRALLDGRDRETKIPPPNLLELIQYSTRAFGGGRSSDGAAQLPTQPDLSARHRVDASAQGQLHASRQDLPGGVRRAGEARTALLNHRDRSDVRVQAGLEPQLASPVAQGQGGDHRAPDHQVDVRFSPRSGTPATHDRLLNHRHGKLQGIQLAEFPIHLGERAAQGGKHEDLGRQWHPT